MDTMQREAELLEAQDAGMGFEVVAYKPPRVRNSWEAIFLELMKIMLKVPNGKSVRRGFGRPEDARKFQQSLRSFIMRQKMTGTYFVNSFPTAEGDGKFYVYIGKKQ